MSSAQERKERFLKLKAQNNGDITALAKKERKKEYRLYFKESGEITCVTKEADALYEAKSKLWKSWDFDQDDILAVLEHGYKKYRVVQDDKGGYDIEILPIDVPLFNVDEHFVSELEFAEEDADINCQITKNNIVLWLSDSIKKKYEDVFPISATVKGIRILKFFITEKNEPHIVYSFKTIMLGELLVNDQVELPLEHDFRNYSVYTKKLFETSRRKADG